MGVGLIMQMYYNGDDYREIRRLTEFMNHFGMPMNLADIHFECTETSYDKLIAYLQEKTEVTDTERLESALDKIKCD